jgi:hypothetical protein
MPTSADEVWAALAWGAVSSVGLLVGAIAGSFARLPHQAIAMGMSVGAGLLLAGVSLRVAADAIRIAGPMAAALSLLLGQPCTARATRFWRGSVPLTASDAASVFSSQSSRSSLAAEWPSRSATHLTQSRRRWSWESLCGIRQPPSRWCSRSQWATCPRLYA